MDSNFCKKVIKEMPEGFALQEIIFDSAGFPCDYIYVKVNEAFRNIINKNESEIIGKRGSEILEPIKLDLKSHIRMYEDIIKNGGNKEERIYSKTLNSYFKIYAYSPMENHIISIMTDITKEVRDAQEKTTILEALSDQVFELDEELNFINVFAADENLLFIPKNQIIGMNLKNLFLGELREKFLDALKKAKSSGDREEIVYKSPNIDNKWYRAKIRYSQIDLKNTYIISVADITEQKLSDEALEKSEKKYRLIAEGTSDVIWVFNVSEKWFTYISPSLLQLNGYKPEEVMGWKNDKDKRHKFLEGVAEEFDGAIRDFKNNPYEDTTIMYESQQPCKDGKTIWIEISAKLRYNELNEIEIYGTTRNADARKSKEAEIVYLSFHDIQTGLFNRNALKKKSEELTNEPKNLINTAVIFIDIDNFGLINDTLGHKAGDRMLEELSEKIRICVGNNGTTYRYGGDEFVAFINTNKLDLVNKIAKQILRSLARPINIKNRCFLITASIGICMGDKGDTADQLIKNADTALYISKKKKNQITTYSSSMKMPRTRDAILEEDMHMALQNNEFEIYYQPVVDVKRGIIRHAEALLRWNHPQLGIIKPTEFIPISERNKLIIPITDWILSKTISSMADWKMVGLDDISVGVNLSMLCFENRREVLISKILDLLEKNKIKPSKIKLEITESMFMNNPEETIDTFNEINKFGIGLVLDDFGTGYSSLGYLKSLPLSSIKLDGSLLDSIDVDEKEQTIVESLINIIHGLKLVVVAECVETKEQYKILKDYNCDYIQGFLFSKALKEEDFIKFYLQFYLQNKDSLVL